MQGAAVQAGAQHPAGSGQQPGRGRGMPADAEEVGVGVDGAPRHAHRLGEQVADDLLQGSAGRFGAGRGRRGVLGAAAAARAPRQRRQRRQRGGDHAVGRLLTGE
nr:hypothetical protein [Streptomyces sp. RLB1-33]